MVHQNISRHRQFLLRRQIPTTTPARLPLRHRSQHRSTPRQSLQERPRVPVRPRPPVNLRNRLHGPRNAHRPQRRLKNPTHIPRPTPVPRNSIKPRTQIRRQSERDHLVFHPAQTPKWNKIRRFSVSAPHFPRPCSLLPPKNRNKTALPPQNPIKTPYFFETEIEGEREEGHGCLPGARDFGGRGVSIQVAKGVGVSDLLGCALPPAMQTLTTLDCAV